MKSVFLTLMAVVVLLLNASPLWAQEEMPLELVWEVKYLSGSHPIEQVCPKGKLLVTSGNNGRMYLYNLNTGELIYMTTNDDEQQFYLMVNDVGDKFYIRNREENTYEEYDVKTKALIQKLPHVLDRSNGYYYNALRISPDNVYYEFHVHPHSFVFKDLYTGTVLDSFKVPNSPDVSTFDMVDKGEFSYDGRYFKFGLSYKFNPATMNKSWFVYDRQAKEIVFTKHIIPKTTGDLDLVFYNTKNWMLVSQLLKLPGDDTRYNYLSEFDLDIRDYKEHVKINKLARFVMPLLRLDDKMYRYNLIYPHGDSADVTRFYDYENKRTLDYTFKHNIHMFDSISIWFLDFHVLRKYRFDWSVVDIEDKTNLGEQVLYPNPTTGAIALSIDEAMYGGHWQIIDLNGNELKQGLIGFDNNLSLNIDSLWTGTYILNLQKDKILKTYKILLQR